MVSAVVAEELKSGPAAGRFAGRFNVNDVTGPKAGTSPCYRCRAGYCPVVGIFTRKIDDNVASLIKNIDGRARGEQGRPARSFVVLLTDDLDGAEKQLKTVAEKNGIKNVPLTTSRRQGRSAGLQAEREGRDDRSPLNKSKVEVNHAFEAGKLDKDAVAAITKDTAKIPPTASSSVGECRNPARNRREWAEPREMDSQALRCTLAQTSRSCLSVLRSSRPSSANSS